MVVPIIILLAIILLSQALQCWSLVSIERWLATMDVKPKEKINDTPKVTDPFTKPKPIYSSTNHIIVPKTPTEIRNENFKKIKEGVEYGDIA